MSDTPDANVNRRTLLATAAAAATAILLDRTSFAARPTTAPLPDGAVDAGPLDDYRAAKVYDAFREQKFFVVNRDQQIRALSSVCTHKGCIVHAQADQSYLCKCHGSRFDKDGHVTKGPAKRDLPHLAVAKTDADHLLVNPKLQAPPPRGSGE